MSSELRDMHPRQPLLLDMKIFVCCWTWLKLPCFILKSLLSLYRSYCNFVKRMSSKIEYFIAGFSACVDNSSQHSDPYPVPVGEHGAERYRSVYYIVIYPGRGFACKYLYSKFMISFCIVRLCYIRLNWISVNLLVKSLLSVCSLL